MAPDAAPGGAPPAPAAVSVPDPVNLEASEEQAIRLPQHWRRRRVLVTTTVFLGLWAGSIAFIHAGQGPFTALFLLVPLYLITLPLVLKTPRRFRRARKPKTPGERLNWQARLMMAVVVFLALYVPFTFFSNAIIPYAPIVEYFLFALAVLLLLRLAGRSIGVASSLDALPPPTHRAHQQVVAPLDDAHYQRTLLLNYGFVEKGRGQRNLSRRLGSLLEANGVEVQRRTEILNPLEGYREPFAWGLTRAGREKRRAERQERGQVLQRVFDSIQRELETHA